MHFVFDLLSVKIIYFKRKCNKFKVLRIDLKFDKKKETYSPLIALNIHSLFWNIPFLFLIQIRRDHLRRAYRPQRSVFAVSNPALPRNMRSLFLASERYTMKYPLLKSSRMLHLQFLSHDKSWSQIFLTGIFVFLSVILLITITVMIVFLVQISTEKVFDKTVSAKYLSSFFLIISLLVYTIYISYIYPSFYLLFCEVGLLKN